MGKTKRLSKKDFRNLGVTYFIDDSDDPLENFDIPHYMSVIILDCERSSLDTIPIPHMERVALMPIFFIEELFVKLDLVVDKSVDVVIINRLDLCISKKATKRHRGAIITSGLAMLHKKLHDKLLVVTSATNEVCVEKNSHRIV